MWKDITSYSRGQIERTPAMWEFSTKKITITLMRNHRDYKDQWVISCYVLSHYAIKLRIDNDATLEQAQNFALSYVKSELSAMLESLSS